MLVTKRVHSLNPLTLDSFTPLLRVAPSSLLTRTALHVYPQASCKGDYNIVIMMYTVAFIMEFAIILCVIGVVVVAQRSPEIDPVEKIQLPAIAGMCLVVIAIISASIATAVISGQSGCWGWYVQGPCKGERTRESVHPTVCTYSRTMKRRGGYEYDD